MGTTSVRALYAVLLLWILTYKTNLIFTASVNRTNSDILKPHLFLIQNPLHYYRSEPVCLPPHAQIIQHLQLNKSKMIFFLPKPLANPVKKCPLCAL